MCDSLRGQYLIAGKQLRDPNFFKTVVLIVEHGEDGAMGLVVNRPSSVTVGHALSEHFKLPET
ncbi:MAG: YqgE/AlgH family protein, partial [Planctomycetes bacterium]|nr:YqgE/AlgH family protein [Planctomycetota bacterium]